MKTFNLFLMIALFVQNLVPVPARPSAEAQAEPRQVFMQAGPAIARPTMTPTAPAVETPTATPAPAIGLALTAEPVYVTPGEPVTILWDVSGLEGWKAEAFLRFYAPSGFTPMEGVKAKFDEQNSTYDVLIDSPSGKIGWNVDAGAALPMYLTAELWQGGEMLATGQVEISAVSETIVDVSGGEAVGMSGQVRVKFPEGAAAETLKVKIERPSKESLPIASLSGSPFEITAFSESKSEEVSKFSQPVTIEVSYVEGIWNGSEADTRVYWYDPEANQWKLPLDQSINTETNIITVLTDHFTVFDTYNSNFQTAETPTMSFFQHSTFTGASSFSMPIKVPAGPGGFKPDVSISYSGQTVDSVSSESQAQWVGMGWNVTGGGYIERNGRWSNSLEDDSFQLNTAGMSGELILGADGWHLGDENFAKVTYDSTNKIWKIVSKDGTEFLFDLIVEYNVDLQGHKEIWRWMLTKVKNIHGQEITYTYAYDTRYSGLMVTAVYPEEIRYSNGRYRVLFVRNQYRSDYKSVWTTGEFVAYQQSLLDNIRIEQDSDGNGTFETLIRKYQFTYCQVEACNIFPKLVWDMGGRTPTLLSVQEFGLNGAQGLPAYTFTYGDAMHLTQATNGYGGTITYVYNNQPNNADAPQYAWHDTEGGNPRKFDYRNDGEGWYAQYNSGTINFSWTTTYIGFGTISFQPGRYYKAVARVRRTTPSASFRLGFDYILNGNTYTVLSDPVQLTSSFTTVESPAFFLPVNATKIIPKMVSSGGTTQADWYYLTPLPTYSRVTAKTLSTSGQSYTWNYSYLKADGITDSAATNNPTISATAALPHPYTKPYTEFRGHSRVTETDPYDTKTINDFNQSDCLSGRSSAVEVKDSSGTITYTKSTSSYECTITPSTVVLIDGDQYGGFFGQPFQGIEYRWVRTVSETKKTYRNAPYNEEQYAFYLTTENTYDLTYGNLIQSSKSGTGVPTVITQTEYYPNTSGGKWLVGLPARTWVESDGVTLSDSVNLYDGANAYTTQPTMGILTATRSWVSGNLETGNYSQASMTYDDWGNVTSQTAWTGYGTRNSAPTTGARTSTTCYGGSDGAGEYLGGKWCPNNGYHTYALWTKNPLGHESTVTYDYAKGVPLSETDPNGAVTSATYDVFGRFTSLARPSASGPSETSPSLNVSYQNSPFKVTLTQAIDTGLTFTVVRNYDGMGRQTSTVTNGVTTLYQYGYEYGPLTPRVDKVSMPGSTSDFTTTKYDALGRPDLVTAPDGTQTDYIYNGLETKVKDANLHETITVTDILGRTLSVTPPTGPAVSFTYDPLGNLLTATRGGATMILTYDKAGRKLTMADPDMGNWSYVYNALGNMTSQTDARLCVITLGYDVLNRPTSKASSGAGCGTQVSTTYTYDVGTNGKGGRTSMNDASGSTSWLYDSRGRVWKETKVISSSSFVTEWTYNLADLPVTMKYPDGEIVTTTYDNNMLSKTVIGTATYVSNMNYDSAGRLTSRVLGNGLTQTYTYYPWNQQGGRLQTLITGTLQNLSHQYDAVGNITQIANSAAGETSVYGYDTLDRLTSWQLNQNPVESYSYDSAGNLDVKNGLDLNYNDASHKHAVTHIGSTQKYWYDQNGNQVTRVVGADTFTLIYDAENRLVEVKKNSVTIATFTFDGDGKRVKSVINGETILFVGAHFEQKGGQATKYYFAGATRIAMRKYTIPQNMTVEYMVGDHLGSTSITTDTAGVKISEMRYKAWGETRYTWTNAPGNTSPTYELPKYQYTGQYSYTAEFGLHFYNARWYDSLTGRFAQADTMIPQSQGTQAYDRYAFVNNNPVRYSDPTGHDATPTPTPTPPPPTPCSPLNPSACKNEYPIYTSTPSYYYGPGPTATPTATPTSTPTPRPTLDNDDVAGGIDTGVTLLDQVGPQIGKEIIPGPVGLGVDAVTQVIADSDDNYTLSQEMGRVAAAVGIGVISGLVGLAVGATVTASCFWAGPAAPWIGGAMGFGVAVSVNTTLSAMWLDG